MRERLNPPRLVDPIAAHQQQTLRALGIPSGRDRTLAELRARRVDPEAERPRIVAGQWADGTAGQNLLAILAEQGIVEDHTVYGDPGFQTIYGAQLPNADSPVIVPVSQASADTASTTNTVTTVEAMDYMLPLTSGLWLVSLKGSLLLTHSTGGSIQVALIIHDQFEGPHAIPGMSATVQTRVEIARTVSVEVEGEAGIYLSLRYCGNSAGTTAGRNPSMLAIARRVE